MTVSSASVEGAARRDVLHQRVRELLRERALTSPQSLGGTGLTQ